MRMQENLALAMSKRLELDVKVSHTKGRRTLRGWGNVGGRGDR